MPLQHVIDALPTWAERAKKVKPFHDYYRGKQPLRFATADFRRKYGSLVSSARENVCIASVTGFVDEIAVESWQGDQLPPELMSSIERLTDLVFTEMLRTGDAFVIVAERADGSAIPIYQPSDLVVPSVDPEDPTVLTHAVKIWAGEDRRGHALALYEDRVERYITVNEVRAVNGTRLTMPKDVTGWRLDGTEDEAIEAHSFGAVPVLWFKHDPDDHWSWGNSILNDVLPLQDLINKTLADAAVLAEAYSRPLYYVLRMAPQHVTGTIGARGQLNPLAGAITNGPDPETVAPRRQFDPTRQQIMAIDGEGPVGSFTPADLDKLVNMRADLRQAVSNVTGLPSYVFRPVGGEVPSGESLKVITKRQAAVVRRATQPSVPVWHGLLQLLGYSTFPVFRELSATPETTAGEMPAVSTA